MQKIAAINPNVEINFTTSLEVDFFIQLEQFKKTTKESLLHYKKNYIVLRNNLVVGDHAAFITLARDEFNIEDAEVTNTIVGNRLVREGTFRLMAERGRPLVFVEFVNKSATKPAEARDYGKVYIEL